MARRKSSNFVFDLEATRGGKRPEAPKEEKDKKRRGAGTLTDQAMDRIRARRRREADARKGRIDAQME